MCQSAFGCTEVYQSLQNFKCPSCHFWDKIGIKFWPSFKDGVTFLGYSISGLDMEYTVSEDIEYIAIDNILDIAD